MSRKPSPSRIRFKAERKTRRANDPIIQAKARNHAKQKDTQ